MTKEESDTFKILSCLQYWDAPLFDELLSKFNPRFQGLDSFSQVVSFSFVTNNESNDSYVIHQLMQKHLYDDLSKKLSKKVNQIHQFCFDYLSGRLLETEEISAKREFILRITHHSLKVHSATDVYRQTLKRIEDIKLDWSVHFSFLIQLFLPVSEKLTSVQDVDSCLTLAECYGQLGIVLTNSGRYKDAEAFFWKSLEIREPILGIHPQTATSYGNIGNAIRAQERYDDAEPMLRRAL